MAAALSPPTSSNKHWWPRISSSKESASYISESRLYVSGIPGTGNRPHTASGTPRPNLMTSVTNQKSTPSNVLTSSSKTPSRFNLAAVIGFGIKSKKQQPVDIQDPPVQVRSLPSSKANFRDEFVASSKPTSSSNPRLSRGVASSASGTSRASTDGPLTPADEHASGPRISYPHSLMTLTDLSDPFATTSPLSDRRSSAHSDKSVSRRLMHKMDGKSSKTHARLPVGEAAKGKESRDRSATLPSRVRASDGSDAYQPLRAVEPPWAEKSSAAASPSRIVNDHSKTVRGLPFGTTIPRSPKNSKAGLPWPDARKSANGGQSFIQAHQRTHSSSSISKENLPDAPRTHHQRPSTSSSIPASVSSMYTSTHPLDPPGLPSPAEQHLSPSRTGTPSTSSQSTPTITTQFSRKSPSPRPPPTTGLPPTPAQESGLSSPSHLHTVSSHVKEQHPLRARSGTAASTSALSFASTLSSLSFTSKSSPQEPSPRGAYGYPSLMAETLPVPDVDGIERRGSNSGSSSSDSHKDPKGGSSRHLPGKSKRGEFTPKSPKATLPESRPHHSPQVSSSSHTTMTSTFRRERALSSTSSTFSFGSDAVRTLRTQRSFHNTSTQAPNAQQPTLRHYASFDPSVPPGQLRSAPPHDSPSLPPLNASTNKRGSTGKDPTSPRRKLFGTKHDRERKQEPQTVDTNVPSSARNSIHPQTPTLHHSSSWFDDNGGASEPASASSTTSATHDVAQHIVPPAELLRLGAAWERECENQNGLRRAKSSWSSRDSSISFASFASSSKVPLPRAASNSGSPPSDSGSKLPRSASLLSKATSAPSFGRHRGGADLPFESSAQEPYTSLSPPPRRTQRTASRPSPQTLFGLPPPPPPRRALSNATAPSGSTPPKKALIERKPSFLDMSAGQRVSLDVPDPVDRGELERDSFLELSRGMESFDTIRESIDSVDSFMQ